MDLEEISKEVANFYKMPVTDIKKHNRRLEYVLPRNLFCLLAYRQGNTYKSIAEYLGRDHSSIMHSVRTAQDDPRTEKQISRILGLSPDHFSCTTTFNTRMFLNYEIK